MMKETFKVVEVTVQPDKAAAKRVINPAMPHVKAIALRDKLNDQAIQEDYDSNKLVSYLVQRA